MPRWPGKGSAFEGVRNYYHLWQYHPEWYLDDEDPPPPGVRQLYPRPEVPRDHPAYLYLDNRQHDAGVFRCDIGDDTAELEMNDYDAWRLANVVRYVRGQRVFSGARGVFA